MMTVALSYDVMAGRHINSSNRHYGGTKVQDSEQVPWGPPEEMNC